VSAEMWLVKNVLSVLETWFTNWLRLCEVIGISHISTVMQRCIACPMVCGCRWSTTLSSLYIQSCIICTSGWRWTFIHWSWPHEFKARWNSLPRRMTWPLMYLHYRTSPSWEL